MYMHAYIYIYIYMYIMYNVYAVKTQNDNNQEATLSVFSSTYTYPDNFSLEKPHSHMGKLVLHPYKCVICHVLQ